ncbi:Hypothetical protein RG1141_CH14830 [Neorhizobium galegae bv. officinalis bv. officinalis str. HAMBI 1141]|uniref:Uncharacterized protein n=1 Tax=Neorhizobium galegae bv. officinalis bv. officinalis str. HAMBI 1141 TaxID=1028801 RepID=A0A068T722_NEOGA|nr:hypothetical protein [Neorhizobium galegae]CDN53826.1 Hypothetical protein RG1141_CH14830 [Neorhizobium galegae bv. officinalis bv. officinalis str. HAMBI 1141]
MKHNPHPVRFLDLPGILEDRPEKIGALAAASRRGLSGRRSRKENDVALTWADNRDLENMSTEQQQFYLLRVEKLKGLVGSVFGSGDVPNVYDVADLIGKLPDQNISDWNLSDLVIPGGSGFSYFDLGHQEALVIDKDKNLYFEGAYVQMTESDDERSRFDFYLVINDPEFDRDESERTTAATLGRMANYVHMRIGEDNTIEGAYQFFPYWNTSANANEELRGDWKAATAAINTVIKAATYIASEFVGDIEFGYSKDAPRPLVVAASEGDLGAIEKLTKQGFPMIKHVGRNIGPIAELEEPRFETSATYGR